MRKIVVPVIVTSILLGLIVAFLKLEDIRTAGEKILNTDKKEEVVIDSFDECVKAKYPVQESYPRRCVLPSGTAFTEEIGELDYDIILEVPRPNTLIESPLEIKGEAAGPWFFEASFTAELVDNHGEVLATAILTTEAEWMTEKLVPFYGTLEFEQVNTTGELIFKSANPSGLSENQKIFSIPVSF